MPQSLKIERDAQEGGQAVDVTSVLGHLTSIIHLALTKKHIQHHCVRRPDLRPHPSAGTRSHIFSTASNRYYYTSVSSLPVKWETTGLSSLQAPVAPAQCRTTLRRIRVGRIAPNPYQQPNAGYFLSSSVPLYKAELLQAKFEQEMQDKGVSKLNANGL